MVGSLRIIASVAMMLSLVLVVSGLIRAFLSNSEVPVKNRWWLPGTGTSVAVGSVIFLVSLLLLMDMQ